MAVKLGPLRPSHGARCSQDLSRRRPGSICSAFQGEKGQHCIQLIDGKVAFSWSRTSGLAQLRRLTSACAAAQVMPRRRWRHEPPGPALSLLIRVTRRRCLAFDDFPWMRSGLFSARVCSSVCAGVVKAPRLQPSVKSEAPETATPLRRPLSRSSLSIARRHSRSRAAERVVATP